MWPLWGRGRSSGPRMAAMRAWPCPVSWAPYGRRRVVAKHLGPVWPPWGLGRILLLAWQSWGRGRSPGPLWPPWGRGRSPVPVWLPWGVVGPLGPDGRSGGVSSPIGPVWLTWGCGQSSGPRMVAVGSWTVPWFPYGRLKACTVPPPHVAAVVTRPVVMAPYGCHGGWPIHLALYGRRGGVAYFLCPVWPLRGRGRFPGTL